jgi:translation elongation factor EF-1beta
VVVEKLLARFGSGVVEETVAVLTTVPVAFGLVTMSLTVAVPPAAIVPTGQLTVLVPEQDPCEGVADTNVVPAGRMSLTVTPAAGLGPAFVTVIV